jgi:hypothetical protein
MEAEFPSFGSIESCLDILWFSLQKDLRNNEGNPLRYQTRVRALIIGNHSPGQID